MVCSFFLSFPSRALFKGLLTVETAFSLFDIAAFRIRRHLQDVLQARSRLIFSFALRFCFLLFTWSIFKILTFSHYGWNEVIDPLSHLQGQRRFSLKCFNFSQPESIRVNHAVNTLTKREGNGTLCSILGATKSTYLFGFTIFTFSANTGLFILECF
ncbi:unnamed protein product [Acanthosepion pharaonis]|uniref:Uncharacterized protein n=1 Tax=Acanthosepion pharaonis TaxID=158019 RepID=A0A812EJB9_ACAPH|nr:unnamed protein product [Sepia pharaonis]